MVDYESFEDVLKDLNIDENDLKRLVSEGALRAYRDEDRMKFRKDDIESLRRQQQQQAHSEGRLEVVEDTEETMLDVSKLSDDVDFEDTGATSVPTVEIDVPEDADATLTEELVFEDIEEAGGEATLAMDDALSLGDDDLGLETQPLGDLGGDATLVEGGDDITIAEGDEITLGGDELGAPVQQMDLMGGAAVHTGASTSYAMAPPPMMAPQIQVQEKIKYVEILPSETWWTKLISAIVLVFACLAIVAVIGAQTREELGIAEIGWSVVYKSGPMSDNPATKDMKLMPVKGDGEAMPPNDPKFWSPDNWFMTSNSNSKDALVAPGMSVLRADDGSYPTTTGFNDAKIRVNREQMAGQKPPPPNEFRRDAMIPGIKRDGAAPNPPPPAPAPEPTPAPEPAPPDSETPPEPAPTPDTPPAPAE